MDTIKSYLETMFANLPATAEVLKAKDELWGMMNLSVKVKARMRL